MSERSGTPWLNWILAGLCVCAIAVGALVAGAGAPGGPGAPGGE